mmetsp:Transcript_33423/g.92342  ORF Transcript_33423/g.92342 Transcript_33423/m.92342 type:complete len:471 (-) Transcript_33423:225-1637(-)
MANLSDDRAKEAQTAVASGGPLGNVYLLSYAFNQDHSCFVCGTTAGFRVFKAAPVEEVHRRETPPALQHKSVVLIAMLFKTNIFAMVTVSEDDPSNSGLNKVHIWDDQRQKIVGELRCRNEVKGVALRRDIIAMICEYNIYVYTCSKLEVICTLPTIANSRGLCALAPAGDPWILCCPVLPKGAVKVQVGQDDQRTHVFVAHQTGLAAMSLNETGSLIATASETGTVVKVFKLSDGQLLYRLRRGAGSADIHCLAFRSDRFLAVASSSSTVHIFKLDPDTGIREGCEASTATPPSGPADDPAQLPDIAEYTRAQGVGIEQLASQLQKAVTKVAPRAAAETVTSMVKGVVPSYFNDLRSFAQFRIPDNDSSGHPLVDARSKQARILGPQLAFHHHEPVLFVLHYSGVIYECGFSMEHDMAQGTQECCLARATTWFAVRPDFKVQGPSHRVATVAGGAGDDGDEGAEEWQLL